MFTKLNPLFSPLIIYFVLKNSPSASKLIKVSLHKVTENRADCVVEELEFKVYFSH